MSVINTNITAMIGQQNLGRSQSALQTSMERLSSGLRINSAKDDAAGQAIANRMSAQITGLSQAQRNANDGISVAQTAEGALNQINDNLQRIRELTVQSQNGTNSADDLQSIQDEINQRLDEVNRISKETSFNGVNVLAKDQNLDIQVGANDGEKITLNLKEITASTLNLSTFNVTGPQGTLGAPAAADYQAAYGETTNVTTTTAAESNAGDLAARLGVAAGSVTVGGAAQVDESGNWYVQVDITANGVGESNALKALGFDLEDTETGTYYIALDPDSADVTTTPGTAAFTLDTANLDLGSLTTGRTSDPLSSLDSALNSVDSLRSELGALQNRFEAAIDNLSTTTTNLSAARSRIEDADYAVEVSNMTRAQILQQAGTSVLAQANQVPQSVLSLLG
ncbi:FliC/FljB family flagellin [Alloalcanivorax xenomutans]|uniref:FliC/FljB family flagellin n=1 Tax=Alloalcanivorax xenomutans TaxID=1094342 RepID=UPI0029346278|nr:FliC/FljB family flagellin [Alloalcanivorax xenomutans]WOD27346.1 FliC/FljB family flagellin [Alloalcanivorax xenomutans]